MVDTTGISASLNNAPS